MYVIKSNRKTNSYTVRKINRITQVVRVGRRGLQGEIGPQGPKGDQGDPATNLVQSVNGKQGVVVLNSTDVGADPTGSASQALQDAKDYTDTEVSTLDSSLATVAKTGSYDDLSNKPTIPSIAGLATEAQVQDVQDNLDAHEADTANPHSVTKAQVGLGNVDNTSDANKPVSTATQTALDAKTDFPSTNGTIPTRGFTGAQVSVPYTELETNFTIAYRATGGRMNVGTPLNPANATTKSYVDAADALKVNKAGDTINGDTSIRGGATTNFVVGNTGSGAGDYIQTFRAVRNLYLSWLWGRATNESEFLEVSLISGRNYWDNKTRDFVMRSTEQDNVFVAKRVNGNVGLGTLTPAQKLDVVGNARINGVDIITGTGFPNGVVSAPVGSTYIDTNATNGAVEWKKATGTGNTGWVVSVGDTGWRTITKDPSVLSGSISMKRTASAVYMKVGLPTGWYGSTPPNGATICVPPSGFATDMYLEAYHINGPFKLMSVESSQVRLWGSPNDSGVASYIAYSTSQAWPTTLP